MVRRCRPLLPLALVLGLASGTWPGVLPPMPVAALPPPPPTQPIEVCSETSTHGFGGLGTQGCVLMYVHYDATLCSAQAPGLCAAAALKAPTCISANAGGGGGVMVGMIISIIADIIISVGLALQKVCNQWSHI
jgi:hypothetical protein